MAGVFVEFQIGSATDLYGFHKSSFGIGVEANSSLVVSKLDNGLERVRITLTNQFVAQFSLNKVVDLVIVLSCYLKTLLFELLVRD